VEVPQADFAVVVAATDEGLESVAKPVDLRSRKGGESFGPAVGKGQTKFGRLGPGRGRDGAHEADPSRNRIGIRSWRLRPSGFGQLVGAGAVGYPDGPHDPPGCR